jgi:hypothetical protein
MDNSVGVWERVLREVIGIFWLSTHTPHSNWLIQCECDSEVRIIISRKALLKTQTPHSNCLYQCEWESEYWERFSDIFWLSTHTTFMSAFIYPRVKTYIFPARRCTSLSSIRMQGVHGMGWLLRVWSNCVCMLFWFEILVADFSLLDTLFFGFVIEISSFITRNRLSLFLERNFAARFGNGARKRK